MVVTDDDVVTGIDDDDAAVATDDNDNDGAAGPGRGVVAVLGVATGATDGAVVPPTATDDDAITGEDVVGAPTAAGIGVVTADDMLDGVDNDDGSSVTTGTPVADGADIDGGDTPDTELETLAGIELTAGTIGVTDGIVVATVGMTLPLVVDTSDTTRGTLPLPTLPLAGVGSDDEAVANTGTAAASDIRVARLIESARR